MMCHMRIAVFNGYSEKNIIRYIGLGFSVSTISRMLKKNVKTVSSQKRSAMRKLNMNRDIELYQFLSHSILM
ncbi:LuxR C-terminal-related transcriptional regulator [Serratia symbiotica]|uniref:LuxR C-terminal-related transcriptional regulator n=1 Tax=Serratia symbiotica TaxID=138074 RepID=UPI003313B4A7